jgi:hypothetical protein
VLPSGAEHPFAQSAVVEEVALELAELLVEQIVRLMDETDGDIGEDPDRATFTEVSVGFRT